MKITGVTLKGDAMFECQNCGRKHTPSAEEVHRGWDEDRAELCKRIKELEAKLDNRATADQMFGLLQDISMAGVELDDRRNVVVQIDRAVWQRVQGYKPGDPECQKKLECQA